MRLGLQKEAEEFFKKAIELNPSDGYSHFLLGVYYYRIGMDDAAIASIDRGLKISPENAKAHLFWMPVVEPYAISMPAATRGKINLNTQIVPFDYIKRNTAMHALMKAERV